MKRKLILSLILAFLVSLVNAQVVKVGESQIAEQLCNQGVMLLESGDLQGALIKFNDAISVKSNFAEAYYQRAMTKLKMGLYDDALMDINKALSIETNGTYYYGRGMVKQEKGDLDGALLDYNAAINTDPNLAEAYYYRASLSIKEIMLVQ
jgi:tetratricopeptide (TPR) repeat protein